jgi:hypothetical protein
MRSDPALRFNADPDPAFHFNADQDPAPHRSHGYLHLLVNKHSRLHLEPPVPEFIDPVFTKTSPKRSFSLNRKRAFWLVFSKTVSIILGTGLNLSVQGLPKLYFKPLKLSEFWLQC